MSEETEMDVPALQEAILKGIGLNQTALAEHRDQLKHWISQQHHFPHVDIGDAFLNSFLVGCKGSVSKAKLKIDAYFTCRSKFPDIFSNRDPKDDDFNRFAKSQPLVTLPGRTLDGCRAHVTWLEESTDYDVTAWIKRVVSQWELLLRTDPWSAGEVFLVSGKNFTFSHAAKLTPNQVGTMFSLAQNVYPMRIKVIWFFDAPPACDFIVNKILKAVVSKKLSERIQVCKEDFTVLKKDFSASILPKDYGGHAPRLDQLNDGWLERLSKHRDWFIGEGISTTDEKKRPSATIDSFGGVVGSFRKLQID